MKKIMLFVAVASFAIGTAAYAGGSENGGKKSCCKGGGAKACAKASETKSCHAKEEKAEKSSNSDSKSDKASSTKENAK